MLFFDLVRYALSAKRTARLTREQVKREQQKKFTKLVQFVSLYSPYYKSIIKKHKIAVNDCQPEDFPVLTKADVIEHFDEIVTNPQITKAKITDFLEHSSDPTELFLGKYYVIHTSGSSGIVGYYVYSEKELMQGLADFTYANSFRPFQKFAYIAATKGHFAGMTMASITKKLPLIYKNVQTFDINEPFNEIIKMLNVMQPTSISGYAFALKKLAEAQKQGTLHIHPQSLQSGGEPLIQKEKEYIQDVFGVQLINSYAASEHLLMGLGKDDFDGMYLMENNLIFEIKPTYTLITNLYNYTLPLLRYQMTDQLQPVADTVNRLPYRKVKDLLGRNEFVPTFINKRGEEDFISFHVISSILIKNITKYQMHLIDKKHFTFKICLEPGLKQSEKETAIRQLEEGLQAILDEKLMTNVRFKVEVVDHLWADSKTGKFKLVVIHK